MDQVLFELGQHPVTGLRLGIAAVVLLAFVLLSHLATAYFGRRLLWPGSAGGQTVQGLLSVFRIKVIAVGVLVALAVLGLNMLPLVGVLLALGLIWALSWRTTSEQIWAGLLILWERPFSLGERILVGDYEGEVERVGLRTTTLRSEERMAVHVPNAYLTTHAILNRSKTEGGFGLRIPVLVTPGSDSGEVIAALRRAAERNNRVRSSPSPKAFMMGFSPRGLRFELRAWVDAYTDAMWARNEICRAIQSEFQRAGIPLASGKPGVAAAVVRPVRSQPHSDFDRDRVRDKDRDKDRDRDRDPGRDKDRDRERGPRFERPRPERASHRDRKPGDDSGRDGRRRGRKSEPTPAEPPESLPLEQMFPPAEAMEEGLPLMNDSGAFDVSAPMDDPEIPFPVPEPEPEREPEPEPYAAQEEAATLEQPPAEPQPSFGRSKRRVPRR